MHWTRTHHRVVGHILVSSFFLGKPFLLATQLTASVSFDHREKNSLEPIGNLGPLPFKFSPSWSSEPGFFDIVSQAW